MKEFALDAYRAIVPILLMIIAFWLVRFVKKVDILADLLQKMEVAFSGQNASCIEKHKGINARFNVHDNAIEKIDKTLAKHNTDISIINDHLNIKS